MKIQVVTRVSRVAFVARENKKRKIVKLKNLAKKWKFS